MMGWGTSIKHVQSEWDDMLHYLHGFQHPAGRVKLLAVSDGSLKHFLYCICSLIVDLSILSQTLSICSHPWVLFFLVSIS